MNPAELEYADDSLTLTIVQSGSHGNLIVINDDIAIDCGVAKTKAATYMGNVQYILITHRHADHLNIAAIRHLAKTDPLLIRHGLYVNADTRQKLRDCAPSLETKMLGRVLTQRDEFTLACSRDRSYHIRTFPLEHDVENQGFIITLPDGKTLVHATDTSTMKHCPSETFDYILVEGNYDEDRVATDLMSDDYNTMFRATRNLRHLSIQAREHFVATHSKQSTVSWQLHRSVLFGYDVGNNQGGEK